MCQRVFVTEKSPYALLIIYITAVKLMHLQFHKLTDEVFVDGEVLFAVSPWSLVLMGANTLPSRAGMPRADATICA